MGEIHNGPGFEGLHKASMGLVETHPLLFTDGVCCTKLLGLCEAKGHYDGPWA